MFLTYYKEQWGIVNLWEQWTRITKVVSFRNVFTKANIDSEWITIVILIVIREITIAITRVINNYQRNAKENSIITFFCLAKFAFYPLDIGFDN